jgi:hypothetical protein
LEIVYLIVVVPAATGVTMPLVPTVATEVLVELQVPPLPLILNDRVLPMHTFSLPVIAGAPAFTVTTLFAVQPTAMV